MLEAVRRWFAAWSTRMSTPPQALLADDICLLDREEWVPAGFRHGVQWLNDATTPMPLVADLLVRHAGLSRGDAAVCVALIHARGGALIGMSDADAAQLAAQRIVDEAGRHGHSVRCRAVSVPRGGE